MAADLDAARIEALVAAGLTVAQVATVLQTTVSGLHHRIQRDEDLRNAVAEARTSSGRPIRKPHDWPVDEYDLMELLRCIASGQTILEACEATRIPPPTLKRWRRMYDEVDAAIVAAAMDGRTRRIRPAVKLQCPGPHCGTKTGYDYGCALDPCRTAVAQREFERRHQPIGD